MSSTVQKPWPVIDGVRCSLIDKMGRIKTERQMILDSNRVNPYSDVGRTTEGDKTRRIEGKRNSARSQ